MGNKSSQEEPEQDESVFDPAFISWDDHGNLRYGNFVSIDKYLIN